MAESIGKIIKHLRIQAGYKSLGELHRESGVPISTLSRIESGIQKPQPETLTRLAPYLNVSQEKLMAAAGYLDETRQGKIRTYDDRLEVFLRAIGKLSPEGKEKVYDYIEYVKSQENKKKKKS